MQKHIIKRNFIHQNLRYQFQWAKSEYVRNLMPSQIGKRVIAYLHRIWKKEFPYQLFDDPSSLRCSQFKIKYLKRGGLKEASSELIKEKKILSMHLPIHNGESRLPSNLYLQPSYHAFKATMEFKRLFNRKPGHEPVLNRILLLHPQAIAVEVPVWQTPQSTLGDFTGSQEFSFTGSRALTGHIDLLLYSPHNRILIVADYKPEGYFLRSLPQVAIYGLILKKVLKTQRLLCLSFNEEETWIYNPEIIKTAVEEKVIKYGDPDLEWRNIIKKI